MSHVAFLSPDPCLPVMYTLHYHAMSQDKLALFVTLWLSSLEDTELREG